MTATFARLYGATAFDPDDRQDQIAEHARKVLIGAVIETDATMQLQDGTDTAYLLGGLLVGIVQVIQATTTGRPRDEIDAMIRTSIIQIAPWAVDMARSTERKEPLANV